MWKTSELEITDPIVGILCVIQLPFVKFAYKIFKHNAISRIYCITKIRFYTRYKSESTSDQNIIFSIRFSNDFFNTNFQASFFFCDGTYKCAMHIRCWTTPTIGKYLKRFLGSIPSQYFLIAIFRIGQVCRIILLCCRFFSCRRSYVEPIGSHLDTV